MCKFYIYAIKYVQTIYYAYSVLDKIPPPPFIFSCDSMDIYFAYKKSHLDVFSFQLIVYNKIT